MTQNNVVHINERDSQKALNSLNRVTGLTWDSLPASLVSGGLVINGKKQSEYALERKRA